MEEAAIGPAHPRGCEHGGGWGRNYRIGRGVAGVRTRSRGMRQRLCVAFAAGSFCLLLVTSAVYAETTLLNASYEPTRRFYSAVNKAFAAQWRQQNAGEIVIDQSHAGSGEQARA